MSIETVDTNSGIPTGGYTCTVVEEPKKVRMGKTVGYEFSFSAINKNGERYTHKEKFPVFLVGPLLKALGCEEVSPGNFKLVTEDVADKVVAGEIVYEKYEGREYPKLKNITEEIPF